MPDILIRGMEMPRNCFECPLFSDCDCCEGYECRCGLIGAIGYSKSVSRDSRRKDCPLIELPPHGDLVELDWLQEMAYSKVASFGCVFLDTVDLANAPVIVPSNKEETT